MNFFFRLYFKYLSNVFVSFYYFLYLVATESNLKSQQIELGLLVAARFLLPHSNILSSLLPHPNSARDGGVYNCWIVEELFNAALKSNTVKSIYHRNEIEVGLAL